MTGLELKVINHCKELINKECGIDKRLEIEKEINKLIPNASEKNEQVIKLIRKSFKEAENVSKWLDSLYNNI